MWAEPFHGTVLHWNVSAHSNESNKDAGMEKGGEVCVIFAEKLSFDTVSGARELVSVMKG